LAEDGYLERTEPILLVGESGTSKSHLANGGATLTFIAMARTVPIVVPLYSGPSC
jgi:hypothetical protein